MKLRLVPIGASQAGLGLLAINITRWMNFSVEQRWAGSGGLSVVTPLANLSMSRRPFFFLCHLPSSEEMINTRLGIQTLSFAASWVSLQVRVELIRLTSVLSKILKQWEMAHWVTLYAWGWETAHGLGALAVFTEDLHFVLAPALRHSLRIFYDFSYRGVDTSSHLHGHCLHMVCMQTSRHTHSYTHK